MTQRQSRGIELERVKQMAKAKLETSMLGRRVKLGWSPEQIQTWAEKNPGKPLDVRSISGRYGAYGQQEGEIVNVYTEPGTSAPSYDVLMPNGQLLEGLSMKFNIEAVLPASPIVPPAWEYATRMVRWNNADEALDLDDYGKDGWELAGVYPWNESAVYTFKRRK